MLCALGTRQLAKRDPITNGSRAPRRLPFPAEPWVSLAPALPLLLPPWLLDGIVNSVIMSRLTEYILRTIRICFQIVFDNVNLLPDNLCFAFIAFNSVSVWNANSKVGK